MSLLQDIRIYPPIIAYQCCVPLKQVYPEARVVAKFFSAAFGGREEGRSEDTSRSVKGLQPIGIKLSASLSPPKVIEDGLDVSNGAAGDRLASLARDEQ